ncbi:BlaI/MecI/CopY family transcriptional regulator [Paenibacillus antri]|uniref:BlaI/MecI/CopY family transcriptional regulator n=1 Tax=Paenibacillus antri TaxID=2582848 RepID=A0A5R9G6N1_9BACL|nr:BlaI/MecI/CopY family transcriptional regulator [Paenibacillus antri]TLS50006.1 BlaI/MecI/CopY family transcriptional regulator [Paenibacillus antri]
MTVKRVNVKEEGLNVFFGPLEAKIMELIWRKGGYSAKEMQMELSAENPISFNAVMTVMNRLSLKGYLKKQKKGSGRGRASIFFPVQNKDEFILEQTRSITQGLMNEYGEYVVPHMLDALEQADPELITKLEEKLSSLKSRSSK